MQHKYLKIYEFWLQNLPPALHGCWFSRVRHQLTATAKLFTLFHFNFLLLASAFTVLSRRTLQRHSWAGPRVYSIYNFVKSHCTFREKDAFNIKFCLAF